MTEFDSERILKIAAEQADCRDMWQIGVDVLPEYRGQGVGSAFAADSSRLGSK